MAVKTGTRGNDVLGGTPGNDVLLGLGGDDALSGHEGGDKEFGGNGNDNVFGDAGPDWLWGGDGNDSLQGFVFPGDDRSVVDHLFGGGGDDQLFADYSDVVSGSGGDDQLFGIGDRLGGGPGRDVVEVQLDLFARAGEGAKEGHAVITDFEHGADRLALDSYAPVGDGGFRSLRPDEVFAILDSNSDGVIDGRDHHGVADTARGLHIDYEKAFPDLPWEPGDNSLTLLHVHELGKADFGIA